MSAEIDAPPAPRWSLCAVEYQLTDGSWLVAAEGVAVGAETPEDAYRELRARVARRRAR